MISWCHLRPRQHAVAHSCRIDQQYQFPRPARVPMPAFNPSLQGAATPRLDKFHLTLLVRQPREGLVIQRYHEEVRVRLERVPHTAGFTRSFVETRRRLRAPDRQAASGQYPGVRREPSLPDRFPPRGPTSAMGSQSHPISAELKGPRDHRYIRFGQILGDSPRHRYICICWSLRDSRGHQCLRSRRSLRQHTGSPIPPCGA